MSRPREQLKIVSFSPVKFCLVSFYYQSSHKKSRCKERGISPSPTRVLWNFCFIYWCGMHVVIGFVVECFCSLWAGVKRFESHLKMCHISCICSLYISSEIFQIKTRLSAPLSSSQCPWVSPSWRSMPLFGKGRLILIYKKLILVLNKSGRMCLPPE